MTSADSCVTRLIDDAPADEDAFGSHARIAATIAQLVEETPGGKSIGLSGTWGAGKSTVVHLLQKMYGRQGAARVVWIFDAWAHEGDPLRRTFLESLIRTLAARGWLAADEWDDKLEKLAKRLKVTEKRHAPLLTSMGIFLAGSVLLIPVGTAIFSNQMRSGLTLRTDMPVDWVAVLGLLLMLAPLLSLILSCGWVMLFQRKTSASVRERLLDALTVFVQRTETDSRTQTHESGDPTSLEFEAEFRSVMAAALGADPERRLVMVVDNLDRIGAPQALAIWSTLQTFLHRRATADGWITQLWCLLPFDADAIRRLWRMESAPGSAVAESFLDKTFQLRFEVPPPRLATWKDYLIARLRDALPAHGEEEFFRVYRLFTVRRARDWQAPTPRQLKLFVNQVGSLHRQWQHQIPIEHLAYYVLLQRDGVPIVSELLAGSLPAAAERGLVADDVRHSLAALAYGSAVEQSHELLLRQPILDALEAGAADRLTELSRVSDKFWLVLELAVEQGCQEWPHAEGGRLLHAAAALAASQALGNEPQSRLDALYGRLRTAVRDVQAWEPMDMTAVDGILLLAQQDPALGPSMFSGFLRTRFGEQVALTAADAQAAVADYVRLARRLGQQPSIRPLAVGDLDTYLEVAHALAAADPDAMFWDRFVPSNSDLLVNRLRDNVSPAGWASVIRVALKAGVSGWSELIAKAANGLAADEGYSPDQVLELLAALHALSGHGHADASKALDDLVGGVIVAFEAQPEVERALEMTLKAVGTPSAEHPGMSVADPRALGAWLYTLISRIGRGPSNRPRRGLAPAIEAAREWLLTQYGIGAHEICDALGRAVVEMGDAATLFKVATEEEASRLAMYNTLTLLAEEAAPRVFPPSLVIEGWAEAFPGWSSYEIARLMRTRGPEIEECLRSVQFQARLADACAGVLDAHAVDPQFESSCVSGLLAAGTSDWMGSLGGDRGLPRLLAALRKRQFRARLPEAAAEALREHLSTRVRAGWFVEPELVSEMLSAFAPSDRDAVLDAAVEALAAADATGRASLLRVVGTAVLGSPRLRENIADFAALARHVLSELNDEWLAALTALVQGDQSPVGRMTPESRLELQGLVAGEQSRRTSEQARRALSAFSSTLAVNLPSGGPDPADLFERT